MNSLLFLHLSTNNSNEITQVRSMSREYQKWWSDRLQRDMELLVLLIWDDRAHSANYWRRMAALYI
jgi:esterase/lipase superfamily enzyme